MNPVHLFIFMFLTVCFFLIFVQRDLTVWQKISLLINPALLAVCILILVAKTNDETKCAAELAPAAEAAAQILTSGNTVAKKSAAARIRTFADDGNWQTLGADLEKIVRTQPAN